MPRPLVSVVIPAYNRGPLLLGALQSVYRQTYPHREVIVVDDGSTDRTRALLRRARFPGLRYLKQGRRQGAAQARNRGIRAARGEWVAFLDSDDAWYPRKLERQVEELRDRRVGFVHGDVDGVFEDGSVAPRLQARLRGWMWFYLCRFYERPVRTSTVLVRRTLLEAAGGFDPAMGYFDDSDLWLRLASLPGRRRGWLKFVPEALAAYRVRLSPPPRPERPLDFICFTRRWGELP